MIRSPEVIFSVANAHHSFSRDLWAIGLLFARMILTEPLLDYTNSFIRLIKSIMEFVPIPIPIEDEQEKEQGQGQEESSSSDGKAERIMRAVGFRMNSAARDFLLVKCGDAWKSKFTFQQRFRSKLLKCRPNITIDLTLLQAIDLAERFFMFNPQKRITAVDALAHPFLDRLDSNELIFHYSAPPYSSLWEDEENFSWERYRREISEKLSSLYPSSLSRPDQDRLTLLDRLDWDLTLGEFLRRVDEETFLS
jgi:serine/threonine protein kinase